jgi:hypothetical protein
MDGLEILQLAYKFLGNNNNTQNTTTQNTRKPNLTLDEKDVALLTLKKKDGAVVVVLGTRDTGKSQLSYRLAEFIGKPIFAISPEQKITIPFIKQIDFGQLESVPKGSTIILDDLPVYASSKDYHDEDVMNLERVIPMVRHERCWHLIFASQSAAQADKYILDCDCAFLKPLGLLTGDMERPNVRQMYTKLVMPEFEGKDVMWIKQHAYMLSPTWRGIIEFKMVK